MTRLEAAAAKLRETWDAMMANERAQDAIDQQIKSLRNDSRALVDRHTELLANFIAARAALEEEARR